MVNVKDYVSRPVQDIIGAIFAEQKGLMEKYHEIEKGNGLVVYEPPLNLQLMTHQLRIKDFAWRITEELGEALEALEDTPDYAHMEEEIADALHFLTELSIMVGHDPGKQVSMEELYDTAGEAMEPTAFRANNLACLTYRVGVVVTRLAVTMNCLKNKPWKQSQMMTDTLYFNINLAKTWIAFIQLCIVAEISPTDLYDLYSRKRQVNQFRQRSRY